MLVYVFAVSAIRKPGRDSSNFVSDVVRQARSEHWKSCASRDSPRIRPEHDSLTHVEKLARSSPRSSGERAAQSKARRQLMKSSFTSTAVGALLLAISASAVA